MLACIPLRAAEIRTAAQAASIPKFVTVEEGRNTSVGGLCVDVFRAIERVDPDLVFAGDQDWQPLARIEAGVAHGQLDAACGFLRTPEREARFNYIEPALYRMDFSLAVRADDKISVSNWADVRRLGDQGRILIIHGSGMVRKMEMLGGLTIDAGGRDSQTNLAKLVLGRGRFYMHRSPGIHDEIHSAGMQDKVRVLPVAISTEAFHMIVSKQLPAATHEKLRKAIQQLRTSGELGSLLKRWNFAPENIE
jgi:ABC-type amino acid transport substrate-binding protein